jgi:ATP-binding cassette subfamily C (CFTR/MRP) protein 4
LACYRWTIDIFSKGYRKDLEESDMYNVLEDERTDLLGDNLEK